MTVDAARKKKVLKQLTYGLYVVTTCVEGGWSGASVSWLGQCSFKPPLIMGAFKRDGLLWQGLRGTGRAIVHVPSVTQKALVKAFFQPPEPGGEPPLHGMPFEVVDDLPVLSALPCWFRIEVRDWFEGGDHDIAVSEVTAVSESDPEGGPLRMADTPWKYGG